ncbi:MAG: hypothetical protein OSB05_14905 [Akkermansiaceae bacterium]|nr:hypothetical protein [Akkermansiaceae bacterium]
METDVVFATERFGIRQRNGGDELAGIGFPGFQFLDEDRLQFVGCRVLDETDERVQFAEIERSRPLVGKGRGAP